ncbi:hypothetical protein POTOM_000725 [Populus tomentosa]|uniref:Uncharacterized protein n=1 Tax=Populus tomentosa TaxID=118781 RepID=A0A8X8DGL3_POPTO|nr:hypothetical protein POTOM_000725 [Populus tomentosa]
MATKPLSREEIANTEKKLDMPLDDIIKMSKNTTKPKKQQRAPIKNQKTFNPAHEKALKVRRYMDMGPLVRQGALAQRRSNFHGNQFPLTSEAARKAAVAPFHSRSFGRNFIANSNNARYNAMQFCKSDELCHMAFPVMVSSHIVVEFLAAGFAVKKRAANGGFARKSPPRQNQQQHQGDVGAKQRPQTLDLLFANMKEQRMKVLSRQNNAIKYNGGGRRPRVPWARGRF